MTPAMQDPKRAALTRVALLLMAGHVVRLSRQGDRYVVAGGPLPPVEYVQRGDEQPLGRTG